MKKNLHKLQRNRKLKLILDSYALLFEAALAIEGFLSLVKKTPVIANCRKDYRFHNN